MRIRRLRLTSFSCFEDTGWVEFSSGINIILGQNNAGKTAFLRSLDLNSFEDSRHRNHVEWRRERLEQPVLSCEINVSGEEILDAIHLMGGQLFWPVQNPSVNGQEQLTSFCSKLWHELAIVHLS